MAAAAAAARRALSAAAGSGAFGGARARRQRRAAAGGGARAGGAKQGPAAPWDGDGSGLQAEMDEYDDPEHWRRLSTVDEPDDEGDRRWSENWAPVSAEAEKRLFGAEDEGVRHGPPCLLFVGMPLSVVAKARAELDGLGLQWLKVVPCSAAMLSERTGDALRAAQEPVWAADLAAQVPSQAPARFECVVFSGVDSYEVAQLYQHLTAEGMQAFTCVRYQPDLDGVPLADVVSGRLQEDAAQADAKAEQWEAFTREKKRLEESGEYEEVPRRPMDPVHDWATDLVVEGDDAFLQPGHGYSDADIAAMVEADLRAMGCDEDADLFASTASKGARPELRRKGGRPSEEAVAEQARRTQEEMVRLAKEEREAEWEEDGDDEEDTSPTSATKVRSEVIGEGDSRSGAGSDLDEDEDEYDDPPVPGEEGYAEWEFERLIEQRVEEMSQDEELLLAKMCMQGEALAEMDAMFGSDPEWLEMKAAMDARGEVTDREYLDLMSKLSEGIDTSKLDGEGAGRAAGEGLGTPM